MTEDKVNIVHKVPKEVVGPFSLDLTISLTNGVQTAQVVIVLGKGQLLYKPALMKRLEEAETHLKAELGDDWRLCDSQEYWNSMILEAMGAVRHNEVDDLSALRDAPVAGEA